MARERIIYAAALLILTATLTATDARAERPVDAGVFDYVSAGAYAAGLALVYFGTDPPSEERWRSTTFDAAFRDTLRIESATGRTIAARTSDIVQGLMIAFPILIDAVLVKGVLLGEPGQAADLIVIDAESFFLGGLIGTSLKNTTGRRRPDNRGNHAFPSGHTTTAFTGAGLMCAHHSALRLFENETADDLTCAFGLVAATATGLLRVASDRHWMTDTLAAAAIGLLTGYLMPSLMHDAFDPRVLITPAEDGATVGLAGRF